LLLGTHLEEEYNDCSTGFFELLPHLETKSTTIKKCAACRRIILANGLVSFDVIKNAKNVDEKVDEVKVEADSSEDKFIGGQPSCDQECVVDDVEAKDEAAENCIDEIHGSREWEEDPDEAGHDECEETSEEVWPQA
jgi:hypothetical protein